MPNGGYADAYFGLLQTLKDLFGRPIDLIASETIENPYLRKSIEETKILVYAA
jgi:predicted nucleotidyltransferase